MVSIALVGMVVMTAPTLAKSDSLSGTIRVSGTPNMYNSMVDLKGLFASQYPGVTVQINGSATTGVTKDGINDLTYGRADIATAGVVPTSAEYAAAVAEGKDLYLTVVAYDAICVVVNPDNPLNGLTMAQIKSVFFTGNITDWSQLTGGAKTGPIHIYALDPATAGTAQFFNKVVAGKSNATYVSGTTIVGAVSAVGDSVITDPEGIAYCSYPFVDNEKVLTVNDVTPVQATVIDGSYEISRKFYVITDGAPSEHIKAFINLMLSTAGQGKIRENGLIPVI